MVLGTLSLLALINIDDNVSLVFELGAGWLVDLQRDLRVLWYYDAHIVLVVLDAKRERRHILQQNVPILLVLPTELGGLNRCSIRDGLIHVK